ncbi:MAG: Rieske (2Fe-2S) protein [Bacteroidales bacterium]|jgi:Rieske Fe-S protein
MKQKYNRRLFIKSIAAFMGLTFLGLWHRMVDNKSKNEIKKPVVVQMAALTGVNFFEDFIVIKKDDQFEVLSSKCTHLGCRIDQQSQDKLMCPCHGSSYRLNGQVVTGPAIKPLLQLAYQISTDQQTLTVEL